MAVPKKNIQNNKEEKYKFQKLETQALHQKIKWHITRYFNEIEKGSLHASVLYYIMTPVFQSMC